MSTTEEPVPEEEEVEWPAEAADPEEEPSESTANDGTPGTAAELVEEEDDDDSEESGDTVA